MLSLHAHSWPGLQVFTTATIQAAQTSHEDVGRGSFFPLNNLKELQRSESIQQLQVLSLETYPPRASSYLTARPQTMKTGQAPPVDIRNWR